MNHNRKPLTSKARKKQDKEIKKGQSLLFVKEKEPTYAELTPQKVLKKYPLKIRKKEMPLIQDLQKDMTVKKKKKIPSKRTTPGQVLQRDSAPQSVHVESTRWEKTLDLQNKVHRKQLNAKLLKRQRKK